MTIPIPKIQEIKLTSDNIDFLVSTDYKRVIRPSAVAKLHGYLRSGEGLKAAIHVNKDGKFYKVIDGNHRIEAVKRYLSSGKDRSVDLKMMVYTRLNVEEERKLYDLLAKTVTQSVNDYFKIHFDEVEIFRMIDEDFPIGTSIYSNSVKMSFANLVRIWANKENQNLMALTKEDLLDKAKSFNFKDYSEMCAFFEQYKNIFGQIGGTSTYYKVGPVWLIASIYYRNIGVVIDRGLLWDKFRKKLYGCPDMLDSSRYNSRQFLEDTRRRIVESLNKGWRGTKLV